MERTGGIGGAYKRIVNTNVPAKIAKKGNLDFGRTRASLFLFIMSA
jgi:hypothetical protein